MIESGAYHGDGMEVGQGSGGHGGPGQPLGEGTQGEAEHGWGGDRDSDTVLYAPNPKPTGIYHIYIPSNP
jgi:hypothetical protein